MTRNILFFCILSSSAFAGWRVHYIPEKKIGDYHRAEKVTLTYSEDDLGYEDLPGAFKAIDEKGKMDKLHFIRPHPFSEADDFQNEFIAALKKLAPEEWAAADKSAGNMHNPKMLPLREYLTPAFMQTTIAKQISKDLEPYGLVITGFGQEKLSYLRKEGKRVISGIFHISVAPKQVEQEAEE